MEEMWDTALQRASAFIEQISDEDRISIVFHDDTDGCCAAALAYTLLDETVERCNIYLDSPERHDVKLTPRIISSLRRFKPDYIIVLDLPVDKHPKGVYETLRVTGAKMLVYDHHIPATLLEHSKCTYINPLLLDDSLKVAPPTSCFSYRLYKHYGDKDLCWVAGVGIVGDYSTSLCEEEIEEIQKHYPELYPYSEIRQDVALKTELMTLARLVNAGYQHADVKGTLLAVRALLEAIETGGPSCLLSGASKSAAILHRYRDNIDEEISRYVRSFSQKAEIDQESKSAFYYINPRNDIVSELSTELRNSSPDMIIFVLRPQDSNTVKFSARKSDRSPINLDALVKSMKRELGGVTGGGHTAAVGGTLPKTLLNQFKNRAKDEISKELGL